MKAIRVHEFGGPEVLKLEDVPDLRAGAGQVVVRVKAAGVNPYDTYMRQGTYAIKPPLPYTPGSDAAGIVDSVGEGVDGPCPGRPRLRGWNAHRRLCGTDLGGGLAGASAAAQRDFCAGSGRQRSLRHGLPRLVSDCARPAGGNSFDPWRQRRRGCGGRAIGARGGNDGDRHGRHRAWTRTCGRARRASRARPSHARTIWTN